MTVKITKPALNLREELADLRKPSGIAGEALLRAETPQEQFQLIGAGRRNLIINGDMRIAQRGTSATISDGSNEGYRTLDRWKVLFSSSAGGTATMSQDTTVPNNSFTNSLKIDVTTADTSLSSNHAITLQNRLEAQDIANSGWDYTASNSYLTVSFWARSTKAGTYCVFFHTPEGTSKGLVREYALAANTWKYITLKFKGDSGISFDNNNGHGLTVGWTLVAGSNRYENTVENTWIESSSGQGQSRYATSNQVNFFDSTSNDFYLTGVQLELGSVATEFEHRSYGEELALCQRYYEVVKMADRAVGRCHTTTQAHFTLFYKVTKRSMPSLIQSLSNIDRIWHDNTTYTSFSGNPATDGVDVDSCTFRILLSSGAFVMDKACAGYEIVAHIDAELS